MHITGRPTKNIFGLITRLLLSNACGAAVFQCRSAILVSARFMLECSCGSNFVMIVVADIELRVIMTKVS